MLLMPIPLHAAGGSGRRLSGAWHRCRPHHHVWGFEIPNPQTQPRLHQQGLGCTPTRPPCTLLMFFGGRCREIGSSSQLYSQAPPRSCVPHVACMNHSSSSCMIHPRSPPSPPQVANLVVDPVMISTSGHSLAGSEVGAALMAHLLPLAVLVTPNIPEASALLGERTGLQGGTEHPDAQSPCLEPCSPRG